MSHFKASLFILYQFILLLNVASSCMRLEYVRSLGLRVVMAFFFKKKGETGKLDSA